MGLVTDYVLPEGAVFSYCRKYGAPTTIRFADGTAALYKVYVTWRDMMRRAHSKTSSKKKDKLYYDDCVVDSTFQDYFLFYEWSKKQFGFNKLDKKGRAFSIDKDILSKGKRGYFPESVVYVPQAINIFFKVNEKSAKYLRGVSKPVNQKSFMGKITIDYECIYLGMFDTELNAHLAWCKHKEAHGRELAQTYKDYIDPRVYERLMNFDAHKEFG